MTDASAPASHAGMGGGPGACGLLYEGWPNEDIAAHLELSVTTIKTHLSHLFCKLDASNRSEAVHRAIERAILSTPTESKIPENRDGPSSSR